MSNKQVDAISYHDIRVDGYDIQSIKELKITSKINEHSILKLTGTLNSESIEAINATKDNKTIEVYYEDDGKNTLFYGVVTKVSVYLVKDVYTIKIEAKSLTYLMDIKEKSRTFQDSKQDLKSLIDSIISEYSGAAFELNIPSKPIDDFLVQFEETDFEFLKRIASKYSVPIIPVMNTKSINFTVGTGSLQKQLIGTNMGYEIYKDIDEFSEMSENYLNGITEMDYLTYEITNYAVINLGEFIILSDNEFYMYEGKYEIKDGVLSNLYKFRPINGLSQKRIFNTKIIGSSFDGKVIEVKEDVVKVHFKLDKCQDKGTARWFKYSTLSASPDGSGWYCMPEIGDSVKVYFPNKNENDSIAISSVSNYKKGEGKDKMADTKVKYLRTSKDKEVKFSPNGIRVSCNDGQSSMKLCSDGSLILSSQQDVKIHADKTIIMGSGKNFKMTSGKSIDISSDKNGGIIFDDSGNVKLHGTCVVDN